MTTLLDTVRRYTETHANASGVATTPILGLAAVRATAPSEILHAIFQPLVCLVVQGTKQVTAGTQHLQFSAGDSLIVTADVPIVSQITRASVAAPYLSVVFDLDPAVIAELMIEMKCEPAA